MSFWKRIIEFNDKYFPGWRKNKELIFFSNAIAGEVGELCGLVKRLYGGGTNKHPPISQSDLVFEVVDIMIYCILFLESLGISEDSFQLYFDLKMNQLYERMNRRDEDG